ncbi:MAG: 2-amino-4-hydroxy-6-hydroxymethyldihydropteridine diphosphokinase [Alphaproteobacteria bacterium]|nr:2-amino-4-hydroxy-6-hydroxymethyldihydropteridine diphosphokinase [Alphaproteobacteria bacterium]
MTTKALHKVAIALGSNIGDRLANLRRACAGLARYMTIAAKSPVYETAAAYVTDQPDFLNAAVTGETALDPQALLFTVKQIEREIGRQPTYRYGPRAIDIDILFYDGLRLTTPELTLPHALLAERTFVLRPLSDIAADWPHPGTGITVGAMLKALPEDNGVRCFGEAL